MGNFSLILQNLGGSTLFQLLLSRIFSKNYYYDVKLTLKNMKQYTLSREPAGEISILNAQDLKLLKNSLKSLSPVDRKELLARILFYEQGFQNCYVLKIDGNIVYLQWILYPSENDIINKYFKNIFRPLHDKEVMIENAFTYPKFRGLGYFPYVTLYLLNMAKKQGYTSAITYIKHDKIMILNELYKMGFKITQLIRERKFLGFIYRKL